MNTSVFQNYSASYDLLYKDKDYDRETEYIARILTQTGLTAASEVLEFGSGTGQHARCLVRRGFSVHGVERSSQMVAHAERIPGFTCQVGDLLEINLQKSYHAVLALFHVISYLTLTADLDRAFKQASSHLKPGGFFIFDFWFSPAVYSQGCTPRVKQVADNKFKITRFAFPSWLYEKNCVEVNYQWYVEDLTMRNLQEFSECHVMRHFSLPEVDYFAQLNGFQRILAEEFMTHAPLTRETWTACVALRKVV